MLNGRRGGSTGLAAGVFLIAAALTVTIVAAVAGRDLASTEWRLLVLDPEGVTLAQTKLADGRFALRYRNSVYGSLAEERFVVGNDGQIHLVGLAAEEPAVLGEYYTTRDPQPAEAGAALRWEAAPAHPVILERLMLAATDLGERTLVVDGRAPIALWTFVPDSSPSLSLGAERIR